MGVDSRNSAEIRPIGGRPVGEARLDIVVAETLVLELKAVEAYSPVHLAQLLSYLKATGSQVGLLINFNVRVLRDGIRRVVCTHPQTSAVSSPSPRLRDKEQITGAAGRTRDTP